MGRRPLRELGSSAASASKFSWPRAGAGSSAGTPGPATGGESKPDGSGAETKASGTDAQGFLAQKTIKAFNCVQPEMARQVLAEAGPGLLAKMTLMVSGWPILDQVKPVYGEAFLAAAKAGGHGTLEEAEAAGVQDQPQLKAIRNQTVLLVMLNTSAHLVRYGLEPEDARILAEAAGQEAAATVAENLRQAAFDAF